FFFNSTGNRIFFSAYDETGFSVFVSDGTESGTHRVIDFPGISTFSFYDGAVVNDDFYFVIRSSNTQELWRTDGTECHTGELDFFPDHNDECLIRAADGDIL